MSRRCCEQGLAHTASQLERVVRGYRKAGGTTGWRQEQRRQARWGWDEHGMLVLSARLPAEEGALLVAALERARTALTATRRPDCPPTGASGGVRAGGSGRIRRSWRGGGRGGGGGAGARSPPARSIPPGTTSIWWCCTPTSQVLTPKNPPAPGAGAGSNTVPAWNRRPRGRICVRRRGGRGVTHRGNPGVPLRLGRKTRKIPPALRRALRIRDERCQFPGCHRRNAPAGASRPALGARAAAPTRRT